jgi:hypothetical protein
MISISALVRVRAPVHHWCDAVLEESYGLIDDLESKSLNIFYSTILVSRISLPLAGHHECIGLPNIPRPSRKSVLKTSYWKNRVAQRDFP